jgi:hypothetical protein
MRGAKLVDLSDDVIVGLWNAVAVVAYYVMGLLVHSAFPVR